jgi:hypothetical protein
VLVTDTVGFSRRPLERLDARPTGLTDQEVVIECDALREG